LRFFLSPRSVPSLAVATLASTLSIPSPLSSALQLTLHSFPTRRSSDLNIENLLANKVFILCIKLSQFFFRQIGKGHFSITLAFQDRKSTRLNSSHVSTSYAVFCLKKKKNVSRAHADHWLHANIEDEKTM